jgi:type II secretory pathway component PulF
MDRSKTARSRPLDRGDAFASSPGADCRRGRFNPSQRNARKKTEVAAETTLHITKADVIRFTEDMGDLLASGLQVEQALQAMENRSASKLGTLAKSARAGARWRAAVRRAAAGVRVV